MATIAAETSALKINASSIKSNLIGSNKKLAKLRVEKIKIIDTISKESIRKKAEKRIEKPIKGITPVIGGAFSKLTGMVRPIKDGLLNVFGTLLLAFAIDKLPKIIETLTAAYEKVKPVWTVATKTLRTIFDGIVSLKPFADQVYDFSKNTFTDISKKTQELTGIETEIDDDLKVFDGLFGEPQDIKEEEPQQEKETNIFSGVGSFFKNLLPGQKNQNKNKIKTQTSNQNTELSQLTREQQLILNGYRKKSTAGTSTQASSSSSTSNTPERTYKPSTAGGYNLKLAKLLAHYEGLRTNAYRDSVGIPTIGMGATYYPSGFRLKGKVKMGDVITEDEALWIKQKHIIEHRARLTNEIGGLYNSAPDRIKAALESVVFNYGSLSGAGIKSIVISSLKSKNYKPIIDVFRNKLAYHNGGINSWRRNDEADIMQGGGSNRINLSFGMVGGSGNVTPIKQNTSVPQSSGSSGGNQTFILPFGIEKILPMFQGPSQSEVNSTTQRRLQRRSNNLP